MVENSRRRRQENAEDAEDTLFSLTGAEHALRGTA